jgi:hypothetical protein
MRIQVRFVLIALLFQASSASAFAADGEGYFQEDCSGTTIHITKIDDAHHGQQLIFRLSSSLPIRLYMTEAHVWNAEAKRCSADGKCEEASHARVWVNEEKGKNKHISGKYEVDFSGQHLEGPFVVKYRKYKPLPICE